MRFRSIVERHGTATGVEVPDAVVDALDGGRRPPVTVDLGAYRYRSTVAASHGRFMLPVSREHRQATGVEVGDALEVELSLDLEPREVSLPADLGAALAAEPELGRRFESLSYGRQRRFVLDVEGIKRPDARQRRVDQAIEKLRRDRG